MTLPSFHILLSHLQHRHHTAADTQPASASGAMMLSNPACIAVHALHMHACSPSVGQHVLERTAVLVSTAGDVEGRFTVGLPAQGRSIMGPWAAQILTQHLPR